MDTLKILIVDDHNLIVEAWMSILKTVNGFEVTGSASTEKEAIEKAINEKPDVVLMDINLKQGSGFDATEQICNKMAKTRVIGLSIHDDMALVKKIFSKGALGYLTKNSSKDELIEAIKTVYKGEKYICTEIKDKYFKNMMSGEDNQKELTEREIEIVKLIANGLTSKEIGVELNVSNRTIDTHRHNILKKLDLPNSAQLSIWAKNKGYI